MNSWEAWLTVFAAATLLVGLAFRWASTDLLALSCLAVLAIAGDWTDSPLLPTAAEAVAGFGNPALVTVALLFAVVAGLELTGATELATGWLLKRPRNVADAQLRLIAPVAVMSAFLNNTPIVAALLPVVDDLSKRTRISVSRFYLPLSYAAILGGMCTLIGTSTNLLINGEIAAFLRSNPAPGAFSIEPLGFFEPAWVGLPAAIAGLLYVLTFSQLLLPERQAVLSTADDPRQYTVEMTVAGSGPLIGQSIEDAGLRHLPGLYLAEIQRDGEVLPAVAPTERLRPGDLLVFVGMLESVVDLQRMRGLVPATDQTRKLDAPAWHRKLVEAVVSSRCPLVGKTIREGRFRTHYAAVVIAVARGGQRVPGKLGDVVLESGDVLLLEATPEFVRRRRESRDFFLVSDVDGASVRRPERAWLALLVLVAMVLLAARDDLNIVTAALAAALAMIALRCCTMAEAHRSVDWSVLLVIGAAIGIGKAMEKSGAATALAEGLLSVAGGHPLLSLAAIYLATMLCTEMITNNAAALLMFPIGWEAAESLGANPMAFSVAVMIAASAGFSTPFGYQTNLMVYGPGGYQFTDYLRFGIPLNLIVFAIAMLVIPRVWPLLAG